MKQVFPPDWRTQSRWKRRFYAKYMVWLERLGYLVVAAVIGAFVYAFTYKVDETITASSVAIEPFVESVTMEEPCLVLGNGKHGSQIGAGENLVEVVVGVDSISDYRTWRAAADFAEWLPGDPAAQGFAKRFPKPPTVFLKAPIAGMAEIDESMVGVEIPPGEPIAKVVDFRELRLSASLSGQSAPSAKVGQSAKVSSIVIEPSGGAVFRGTSGKGSVVSSRVLDSSLKDYLNDKLKGRALSVRDDIPLQVQEVTEVAVDARLSGEGSGKPESSDPPPDFALRATVLEGSHTATVQLADLPEHLRIEAEAVVRDRLMDKSLKSPGGTDIGLGSLAGARFVLKMKASAGGGSGDALPGAALSRAFDAKLKIEDPPEFLLEAVRSAYLDGRKVSAKVELSTGSKPIVSTLLKKS